MPDKTPPAAECPALAEGAQLFKGFLSAREQAELVQEVEKALETAPFYRAVMPRWGTPLSVRMTNIGPLGWIADKCGYRYEACHPLTGRPWPAMPEILLEIWRTVAACDALPEACLVNWYGETAKMGQHIDADEAAATAPVVSLSLGDAGRFALGGAQRGDPTQRFTLTSGDVFVLGGPARRFHHGIDRISPGTAPAELTQLSAWQALAAGAAAAPMIDGRRDKRTGPPTTGNAAGEASTDKPADLFQAPAVTGRLNLTLRRVTAPSGLTG